MRKLSICVLCLLGFMFQKTKAQTCPMEIGFHYTIYVFSAQNNFTFKELMGEEINPMLVNVVQVNDEVTKKKIDERCLMGKMETSIFIYPSKESTKSMRFCNQQDYVNAIKNNKLPAISEE